MSEQDVVLRELAPGDVFTHAGSTYILTDHVSAYSPFIVVNLKSGATRYMSQDLVVKKGKVTT